MQMSKLAHLISYLRPTKFCNLMLITDCQVFADILVIAWKRTRFQSGTRKLSTYFFVSSLTIRYFKLMGCRGKHVGKHHRQNLHVFLAISPNRPFCLSPSGSGRESV